MLDELPRLIAWVLFATDASVLARDRRKGCFSCIRSCLLHCEAISATVIHMKVALVTTATILVVCEADRVAAES